MSQLPTHSAWFSHKCAFSDPQTRPHLFFQTHGGQCKTWRIVLSFFRLNSNLKNIRLLESYFNRRWVIVQGFIWSGIWKILCSLRENEWKKNPVVIWKRGTTCYRTMIIINIVFSIIAYKKETQICSFFSLRGILVVKITIL